MDRAHLGQVHDLTLETFTARSVFRSGRGSNINVDLHRLGPYGNLVGCWALGCDSDRCCLRFAVRVQSCWMHA